MGMGVRRRGFVATASASVGAVSLGGLLPFVSGDSSSPPIGFDYYISTTGSNSNPGTVAQPWALTAINTKRATYAGKRVGLLDGTYNMLSIFGLANWSSYGNNFTGNVLEIGSAGSGTSGAWTYIQAVNPRAAILDMGYDTLGTPASSLVTGCFGPGGASFTVIKDLVYLNAGVAGINLDSSNDCIVEGCWFKNKLFNPSTNPGGNSGDIVNHDAANRVWIRNNLFSGGSSPGDSGRHYGVGGFSLRDWIIENNTILVDDSVGNTDGIHVKNTGNGNRNVTVRNNYITGKIKWDGSQAGLTNYINNNVVISNAPLFFGESSGVPETIVVFNNTLIARTSSYSSGTASALFGRDIGGFIHSYNNLSVRQGTAKWSYGDFNYPASAGDRGTIDYNGVAGTGSVNAAFSLGNNSPTYASFALFNAATGHDAHGVQAASASFVGGSPTLPADAYQLQGGSSFRSAGKSDGTTGGVTCDIGAWSNFVTTTYGTTATRVGCDF